MFEQIKEGGDFPEGNGEQQLESHGLVWAGLIILSHAIETK